MYFVPIHVPIYVDGSRKLVTSEWHRSLELLRDSFGGRFGPLAVAAPSIPVDAGVAEQSLLGFNESEDAIALHPSFDLRCRARHYWQKERRPWVRQLERLASQADIVHTGLDDIFRPIAFEGFRAGLRAGKTTIFVQDTDIVVQQRELVAHSSRKAKIKAYLYGQLYERAARWSVARADLSLLKGSALIVRYGRFARNCRNFHDTSYFSSDIVADEALERRLRTLDDTRPLRLVYCGRLTARKGVDDSLRILAAAGDVGANYSFDVIGDGPEMQPLRQLATSLGLHARVNFLGAMPYGQALLGRLASYDALFFTPVAEDTPRMIFDGYAAGLPLVASGIGYVLERHAEDPGGHLKIPRPWPGQNPPPGGGGTIDDYAV